MSVVTQLKTMAKDDIIKLVGEVTKKDLKMKKLFLACMNKETIENATTITDDMVDSYMNLYDMKKFIKNIETLSATNIRLVYEMLIRYLIEATDNLKTANMSGKFGWKIRRDMAQNKLDDLDYEFAKVLKTMNIKSINELSENDNIHKLIKNHVDYYGELMLHSSSHILYNN